MNKKILFSLIIFIHSIPVFSEIGTYNERVLIVKIVDAGDKDAQHFPQKSVKSFEIPFVVYFNQESNSLLIEDSNKCQVYQYKILNNGNVVACGFISSNIEFCLPIPSPKTYVLFIYIDGNTYKGYI